MHLTNEPGTASQSERSVIHSTFVIERSYSATPERVFAAFADPARKRHWMRGDNTLELQELEMDFRVGGWDRIRYLHHEGNPFPGTAMANDATYLDIVPNRRIVMAYSMAIDGRRFSTSLATFELLPTDAGSKLIFTEQAAFFEGADGAQMRESGWRTLLEKVADELAG